MIITQEKLVNEIALKEDLDIATVRRCYKATEDIVFKYLSLATPDNSMLIRLIRGLSIESKYIPEKKINRGIFQDLKCPDRFRVKASVTRYYNKKLNESKC